MKILIVEDDFYSKKLLEDFLKLNNYNVLTATNGIEALELIKKEKFDIIISDIQMPKMTGLQLLRTVREIDKNIIYILITAFESEKYIVESLHLGANNFIRKPINPNNFLSIINKYKKIISRKKISKKDEEIIIQSHTYEFKSYIKDINTIVEKLIKKLPNVFENSEKVNIEIGLLEIISNAIEHGNLGITYKEKQQAIENNTLDKLIKEREDNNELANRKVTIHYSIDKTSCHWIVKDEGNGFDINSVPSPLNENVTNLSGRGIFITKHLFDELEYIGNGSTVKLKKYFSKI